MTEIQSNSIDTSSCDEFEDVEEQRTLKDEDVLEELRLLRSQVDDMREKQEMISARLDPRTGLRRPQSIRNTEEFCNFKLDEDTYSLMMTSKVRSGAWLISLFTSLVFQLGLAGLIGIQFLTDSNATLYITLSTRRLLMISIQQLPNSSQLFWSWLLSRMYYQLCRLSLY